jgi:zinc transporter ZupT
LAAIALGSTLLVARVTKSQFLFITACFSLATPLGVGLGLLISEYFRGRRGEHTCLGRGSLWHMYLSF